MKKVVGILLFCSWWLSINVAQAITIDVVNPATMSPTTFIYKDSAGYVGINISGLGAPPYLGAFDLSLTFDSNVVRLTNVFFVNPPKSPSDPLYPLGSPDYISFSSSADYTTLVPGNPGAGDALALAALLAPGRVGLTEVSLLPLLDTQPTDFFLALLRFEGLNIGVSSLDLTIEGLSDEWGNSLQGIDVHNGSIEVPVPEPGTLILLGAGVLGLLVWRRSKFWHIFVVPVMFCTASLLTFPPPVQAQQGGESAKETKPGENLVSFRSFSFPNSQPGKTYSVKKLLDPKTGRFRIESVTGEINSYQELDDMAMREQEALRKKYGNLRGKLREKFDVMSADERVSAAIYARIPLVKYPNKLEHDIDELKAQARASLQIKSLKTPEDVSRKYGLRIEQRHSDNFFVTLLSKENLRQMMFDDDIIAIEEFIEPKPLAVVNPDYTTLAFSAYNPPPLPTDSLGQGVHAATFERGIWQSHFNCLGNLDAGKVEINNSADEHSQMVFRFLWNSAPEATFYHHQSIYYDTTDSQNFLVNNAIETVSISYTRATDLNYPEFLTMDEFAYRFPFPTFVNPTANAGYQYEVNWQPYNAISVGNVQHQEERHYALNGATQTRNPDPVYGSCIDGQTSPPCAGDWELPHIVAPGITPSTTGYPLVDNKCSLLGGVWSGTSFSAPTLNGTVADVISANSDMKYSPESIRVALLLTAHNVDGGYGNAGVDGRDGAGVVSAFDAVQFAKHHTQVYPDRVVPVEHGLAFGALGQSDNGRLIALRVKVPDVKPVGKHLRIVLTWDSIPDRDRYVNSLSNLDLLFSSNGSTYNHISAREDSNVEIIDVPSNELAAGRTYPLIVSVTQARVPAIAVADFFYWAGGWTWVQDHAQFDPDYNGCVDKNDVTAVMKVVTGINPLDPTFDLNGDGKIDVADARKAATLCTNPGCGACTH